MIGAMMLQVTNEADMMKPSLSTGALESEFELELVKIAKQIRLDERRAHTIEEVCPLRYECEADAQVGHRRVRLEDREQYEQNVEVEVRILFQVDGQRNDEDERVDLDRPQEEHPEVLEHFGEEVPEQSDVRRELGDAGPVHTTRKSFAQILCLLITSQ